MESFFSIAFYIFICFTITLRLGTVQAKAGVHYGRCKNSLIDSGFCRTIEDCSTISTDQKSDANLNQILKCGSNEKKLICCPLNSEDFLSKSTLSQSKTIAPSSVLPQPPICGPLIPDNKIFNGEDTVPDEFPWMVILIYAENAICGGTLISAQFVLTAAHCVYQRRLKSVRLGEWNTETNPDYQEDIFGKRDYADAYIEIGVQYIVIHPLYRPGGVYPNDIALLRLVEPVQFTYWIKPICMPAPASDSADVNAFAGREMQIAGWGRNEHSPAASKRLQKASITVWPKETCQEVYNKNQLYERQICAGNTSGSCRGDSGGPMMQRKQRTMYQTGIISLGGNCKAENRPIIFTKVDVYVQWIVEVMSNEPFGKLKPENGYYLLNLFMDI